MLILPFVVATSAALDNFYFFSPEYCAAIDRNSTCNAHNISGNTLWVPETTTCTRISKTEAACKYLDHIDWNVILKYQDTPKCAIVALYSEQKAAVLASPVDQAIVMHDENGEVGYLPHGLITYMLPGIEDGRLSLFLVIGQLSNMPQPLVGKFRLLGL